MNWHFAIEVTAILTVFGAVLGLMFAAALPHRADERTGSHDEQQ